MRRRRHPARRRAVAAAGATPRPRECRTQRRGVVMTRRRKFDRRETPRGSFALKPVPRDTAILHSATRGTGSRRRATDHASRLRRRRRHPHVGELDARPRRVADPAPRAPVAATGRRRRSRLVAFRSPPRRFVRGGVGVRAHDARVGDGRARSRGLGGRRSGERRPRRVRERGGDDADVVPGRHDIRRRRKNRRRGSRSSTTPTTPSVQLERLPGPRDPPARARGGGARGGGARLRPPLVRSSAATPSRTASWRRVWLR